MIGVAGYYEYIKGTRHGWDLNAVPNLEAGRKNQLRQDNAMENAREKQRR